jgi:AMMECR1 domain-containing protein
MGRGIALADESCTQARMCRERPSIMTETSLGRAGGIVRLPFHRGLLLPSFAVERLVE